MRQICELRGLHGKGKLRVRVASRNQGGVRAIGLKVYPTLAALDPAPFGAVAETVTGYLGTSQLSARFCALVTRPPVRGLLLSWRSTCRKDFLAARRSLT